MRKTTSLTIRKNDRLTSTTRPTPTMSTLDRERSYSAAQIFMTSFLNPSRMAPLPPLTTRPTPDPARVAAQWTTSSHPSDLLSSFLSCSPSRALLLHENYRSRRLSLSKFGFDEHEVFLIFMKVLFKFIERSNHRLRQQAKAVVLECTRRNRSGDSNFSPLQRAVASNLKLVVGEAIWNQAKVSTAIYCRKSVSKRSQLSC